MDTFKNEFTWSHSRAQLFNTCRRAYYHKYYGSWGGWSPHHPAHQIYVLKNLQNRWGWKGSVLHRVIAEYLNRIITKVNSHEAGVKYRGDPFTKPDMLDWIKDIMTKNWETSLIGKIPKMHLIEHYQDLRGWSSTVELSSAIADVQAWFSNFYHSNYHDLFIADPKTWHSVESLSYFYIDTRTVKRVKVWVVLDFALRGPGIPYLIADWKTGKRKDIDRDQLAVYALYAVDQGQEVQDIRAWDIYVNEGRDCILKHRAFGSTSLGKTSAYIKRSILDMAGALEDVKTNTPYSEDRYEVASQGSQACGFCNYREICPNG